MWTQKGKLVLFATVALFVIAMSNDSMVVYGLWGVGAGFLGIAYLLSRRAARGITCRRLLETARTVEGSCLRVRLEAWPTDGGSIGGVLVRDTCRNATSEEAPKLHSFLIEQATAEAPAVAQARYDCPRRGRYRLGPLEVVGSDPFGLFEIVRTLDDRADALAYPRTFGVPTVPTSQSPLLDLGAVRPLPARGHGSELYGVREYTPGDDLRRVHWKATAHVGKLSIKELESTAGTALTIFLDLSKQSCLGRGRQSTTERAIRVAASVAESCLLTGQHVRLRANSDRPVDVPLERGEAQRHRLLSALAQARADGRVPLAASVGEELRRVPIGSAALLVTSVPDSRLKATVAAALQRGGISVVLIQAPSPAGPRPRGDVTDGLNGRVWLRGDEASRTPSFRPSDYQRAARELSAVGARVVLLRPGEDPRPRLTRLAAAPLRLGWSAQLAQARTPVPQDTFGPSPHARAGDWP